jgi:molecular chaperone DnaK
LSPLLGIDFGTTNAAAALVSGKDVRVVPHADGLVTLPAVVAFPPVATGGRPLVGRPAEALAGRYPERVITSVKRLLGRKLEAPEARHQRQEVPYELVMAKNGDARIRVGRRHHAPPDVAAYIFGALKDAAEAMAREPVVDAVVAVPADFNDLQRQAIVDSARIAGLNVLSVMTEPAAVALAAGIYPLPRGHEKKDRKALVYDLGGGSFSVAALLVTEDGVEVLASGGDAFLGGEDFDQRIVSEVCEDFVKAGGSDLRRERLVLPRLRHAAERAKRELSFAERVSIQLPELASRFPDGIELDRARLEGLTQDLVDRTVWPCESVLSAAGWSIEDVETLVMVGGQTRMPRVRAHIADWLGKEPMHVGAPEALIAIGTARQSVALAGGRKRKKGQISITETTCLSLGVENAGGVLTRLIPKGTPLPASQAQVLSTSADGQAHVTVHLLQGEREMAADNDSIARLQIGPLAPAPRGTPQIEIVITTDGSGIPRASARDMTTDSPIPVRVRPSGGLTEAEIATLRAVHAGASVPAASLDGGVAPGIAGAVPVALDDSGTTDAVAITGEGEPQIERDRAPAPHGVQRG